MMKKPRKKKADEVYGEHPLQKYGLPLVKKFNNEMKKKMKKDLSQTFELHSQGRVLKLSEDEMYALFYAFEFVRNMTPPRVQLFKLHKKVYDKLLTFLEKTLA